MQLLGFELVRDTLMSQAADAPPWIEVRAPRHETLLVRFTSENQDDRTGTLSNVSFTCEAARRSNQELLERGVGYAVAIAGGAGIARPAAPSSEVVASGK